MANNFVNLKSRRMLHHKVITLVIKISLISNLGNCEANSLTSTFSTTNSQAHKRGFLQQTYVITLASSIKSSSDIAPSFIILTATVIVPRYVPSLTVCHEINPQINMTNRRTTDFGNILFLPQTVLFLTPCQEQFVIWAFPMYLSVKNSNKNK